MTMTPEQARILVDHMTDEQKDDLVRLLHTLVKFAREYRWLIDWVNNTR